MWSGYYTFRVMQGLGTTLLYNARFEMQGIAVQR
jgi:hypothetical protein